MQGIGKLELAPGLAAARNQPIERPEQEARITEEIDADDGEVALGPLRLLDQPARVFTLEFDDPEPARVGDLFHADDVVPADHLRHVEVDNRVAEQDQNRLAGKGILCPVDRVTQALRVGLLHEPERATVLAEQVLLDLVALRADHDNHLVRPGRQQPVHDVADNRLAGDLE